MSGGGVWITKARKGAKEDLLLRAFRVISRVSWSKLSPFDGPGWSLRALQVDHGWAVARRCEAFAGWV